MSFFTDANAASEHTDFDKPVAAQPRTAEPEPMPPTAERKPMTLPTSEQASAAPTPVNSKPQPMALPQTEAKSTPQTAPKYNTNLKSPLQRWLELLDKQLVKYKESLLKQLWDELERADERAVPPATQTPQTTTPPTPASAPPTRQEQLTTPAQDADSAAPQRDTPQQLSPPRVERPPWHNHLGSSERAQLDAMQGAMDESSSLNRKRLESVARARALLAQLRPSHAADKRKPARKARGGTAAGLYKGRLLKSLFTAEAKQRLRALGQQYESFNRLGLGDKQRRRQFIAASKDNAREYERLQAIKREMDATYDGEAQRVRALLDAAAAGELSAVELDGFIEIAVAAEQRSAQPESRSEPGMRQPSQLPTLFVGEAKLTSA